MENKLLLSLLLLSIVSITTISVLYIESTKLTKRKEKKEKTKEEKKQVIQKKNHMIYHTEDDSQYHPIPRVVANGSSPIRGEVTSLYGDICSRYGSSSLPDGVYEYIPSKWCDIGILTSTTTAVPYTSLPLSAQYTGNVGTLTPSGWRYKVYDKINGSHVYLPDNTVGTGTWRSLRDGDTVNNIMGKPGIWTVQIQKQPY